MPNKILNRSRPTSFRFGTRRTAAATNRVGICGSFPRRTAPDPLSRCPRDDKGVATRYGFRMFFSYARSACRSHPCRSLPRRDSPRWRRRPTQRRRGPCLSMYAFSLNSLSSERRIGFRIGSRAGIETDNSADYSHIDEQYLLGFMPIRQNFICIL